MPSPGQWGSRLQTRPLRRQEPRVPALEQSAQREPEPEPAEPERLQGLVMQQARARVLQPRSLRPEQAPGQRVS